MSSSSGAVATTALVAGFSMAAALIPASLTPLRGMVKPVRPFSGANVMPGDFGANAGPGVFLASGNGHVVAMKGSGDGTTAELYEVGVGQKPRLLTRVDGSYAMPSVGTDRAGRTVVIVQPCAGGDHPPGERSACSLAIVDLASGRKKTLPGTDGDLLGDMDHGQLVTVGAKASVTVGGPGSQPASTARALPIGNTISVAPKGRDDTADWIDALDVEEGRIAVTVGSYSEAGSDSTLLTAPLGGPWQFLALSATGGAAQGSRDFLGPEVTATGVRAYLDGAGDAPSYAARWTTTGALAKQIPAKDVGTGSFLVSAAWNGDTLFTASSNGCDEDCGVFAADPVPLGWALRSETLRNSSAESGFCSGMTSTRQSPLRSRPARRPMLRHVVAAGATASALTLAGVLAAGAAASDPIGAPAERPAKTAPITLLPNDPPSHVLVGAGDGHVVAVTETASGGSQLSEITGGTVRVISTIKGGVSLPTVGTDATNRPVVVRQPCSGPKQRCKLRVYDLATGASKAVAASEGANVGAIDSGQVVFARPIAGRDGSEVVFASSSVATARHVTLPLDPVLKAHAAGFSGYPDTPGITSLDLSRGRIAATLEYGGGGGGSLLLRGEPGHTTASTAPWTFLARSGYGELSNIPRVFRAATVTNSGVRAFYDGGDNDAGFVGRWSARGELVKKIATTGTGTRLIDDSVAFDGDRLVVVPSYSWHCQTDPDEPDLPKPSCPVLSTGTFRLG